MTDRFPLLKTPPRALQLIMQNLEIIDILSLSLTSTKTRMALVPLNHPIYFLTVFISGYTFIFEINGKDGQRKARCTAERFGTTGFSFNSLHTGQELWSIPETKLRSWFLDFLRILSLPGITCFNFCNSTDELEKVAVDLFEGIQIRWFYSQNLLVARKLLKNTDCFKWGPGLGENQRQEFLIRNTSGFYDLQPFKTKITIDDLLMSNMRSIYLGHMYFPLKEHNRFLKCWRRGGTSNLEFLEVHRYESFELMYRVTTDEDNFEERLFKGIPYKKFETSGRFEIRKKNGHTAMIEFKPRSFKMIALQY